MIRVIKEPALSTVGEMEQGEEELQGEAEAGSSQKRMRFEDSLLSASHLIPRKKFVLWLCSPVCLDVCW